MFSRTPELYDLIYGAFKDYASESAAVARILERSAPGARRVLDVGCGTGEHARHLRSEHGYEVDGLDIEPGFVERARQKLPESRFWCADMADFDLGRSYHAILCLFSSIGYVVSRKRLDAALAAFHAHLDPGGVALIEPWFEPSAWRPGRVHVHASESGGRHVVRMSHSGTRDRVSILEFHYLVGAAGGVEHRRETHELGLFRREEMLESLRRAGFGPVEYDPDGLVGRGLYVARTA